MKLINQKLIKTIFQLKIEVHLMRRESNRKKTVLSYLGMERDRVFRNGSGSESQEKFLGLFRVQYGNLTI